MIEIINKIFYWIGVKKKGSPELAQHISNISRIITIAQQEKRNSIVYDLDHHHWFYMVEYNLLRFIFADGKPSCLIKTKNNNVAKKIETKYKAEYCDGKIGIKWWLEAKEIKVLGTINPIWDVWNY